MFLGIFFCFFSLLYFIWFLRIFQWGRAPSGRAGPGPPPFFRVEILKKFSGKSVPENYTLFFGKNYVFGHFTYQNALICV